MTEIDEVVRSRAAAWRAAQPAVAIDFAAATAVDSPPRRRPAFAFAAALVAVALAVGGAAILHAGRATTRVPGAPSTLPMPRPRVVRTIDLGQEEQYPASVAATPDWVSVLALPPGRDHAWVTSIYAGTNGGVNDVQVRLADDGPIQIVAGSDSQPLWVSSQQGEEAAHVSRVEQGAVDATITTRGDASLALRGSSLWVVDGKGQLLRVVSSTARIAARIALPGGGYAPKFVSAGGLGVWLASPYDGSVWRLSADQRSVVRVADVGAYAGPLTQLAGDIWVSGTNSLTAIDARNGGVTHRVHFAARIVDVTSDGHAIWVATGDGRLTRVQPNGSSAAFALPRTGPIVAITSDRDGHNVWVLTATTAPEGQLCHTDCPKLVQIAN